MALHLPNVCAPNVEKLSTNLKHLNFIKSHAMLVSLRSLQPAHELRDPQEIIADPGCCSWLASSSRTA